VIEVRPTPATGLSEPLGLLEDWLRHGEPVPEAFAQRLREAVEAGDLEVLAARLDGAPVGVAVVAYRLNVSTAGMFASVEDLYVVPGFRRRGVGRALLEAAGERCAARGVSYVEAQVEGEEAMAFYEALGYETEPGAQVLSRSYAL
jgi:GNAT superfamily N-acetyltransferase